MEMSGFFTNLPKRVPQRPGKSLNPIDYPNGHDSFLNPAIGANWSYFITSTQQVARKPMKKNILLAALIGLGLSFNAGSASAVVYHYVDWTSANVAGGTATGTITSPGALAILGLGLAGLAFTRRRG